jgi:hypothetical protein
MAEQEPFLGDGYLADIKEIVKTKFTDAEEYANDAWNTAEEFLDDMESAAGQWDFDWPSFGCIPGSSLSFPDPVMPPLPDLDAKTAPEPIQGTLQAVTINPVDIPDFDIIAPDITIPESPTDTQWPTDPGSAPSISYPDIPTKPDYTLPAVPTIEDIIIPSPPVLEIPIFEGTLPVDDVDLPSTIFVYDEAVYSSVLKDAVQTSLLDTVQNGGTGLASDVEEAIWTRARARKDLEIEAAYDEAEEYFASRGFSLPPGALSGRLAAVQLETLRANQQLNYEIMIEQARLAQTNTHFAITSAIQQEQTIMEYVSGVANRALEAAKYTQEAAIALFNAAVSKYNLKLLTYQTCAAVYESRIRAAGLALENYKAQLEGVKITADIQKLQVDLYSAQVSGLVTLMNLYSIEVESAKILGELERIKLEGYREKVNAYGAKLNAITSKYNAYQAQIAGEAAKANVYESQVKGYLGELEGANVRSAINIAEANTKLEINKNTIETFKADIEKYKALAQEYLGELENRAKVYDSTVGAYRADVSLADAKERVRVADYEASIQYCRNFMEEQLARVRLRLDEALKVHEIQVEALKSGAGVSAQMAASALASVAAGAQLSYRGSYDRQDSVSQSTTFEGE